MLNNFAATNAPDWLFDSPTLALSFRLDVVFNVCFKKLIESFKLVYQLYSEIPEAVRIDIWYLEILIALVVGCVCSYMMTYVISFHIANFLNLKRYLACIFKHHPHYNITISGLWYVLKRFLHQIGWFKPSILRYPFYLRLLYYIILIIWEMRRIIFYILPYGFSVTFVTHFIVAKYLHNDMDIDANIRTVPNADRHRSDLDGLGTPTDLEPIFLGPLIDDFAASFDYTVHMFQVPLEAVDPYSILSLLALFIGIIIGAIIGSIVGKYFGSISRLYEHLIGLVIKEQKILCTPSIMRDLKNNNLDLYRYSQEVHEVIYAYSPILADNYRYSKHYCNMIFVRHKRMFHYGLLCMLGSFASQYHPITDRHVDLLKTRYKTLYKQDMLNTLGDDETEESEAAKLVAYGRESAWDESMDHILFALTMSKRRIYFYEKFIKKTPEGDQNLLFERHVMKVLRKILKDRLYKYRGFLYNRKHW